ncbi:rhodanese-like domain-containing protein [Delftia tsuruhatensis]|uniref:rhodanese-like domain-containing protein n=1 Tax=Delftia tsuruhatensis TaxID=180282 RepID=UPI00062D3714|nr:rhodanese-like domain-containing protein [Delftia tsuruhatensis]MDH0850961.1 rhodanese-like domain-containing protein [Delftia tsuruhatensis]
MTASIDAHTLKSWLHDGQEIALLDVREHGQYGESHLFYATPLPYSRLELDVPRLVPRRQVRVVTYDGGEGDASAGVAGRAARRLEDLGYTQVAVLEGGAKAWSAAGYTLFAGVNLPSKTFGELAEHAYGTPRITAQQLAARQAAGLPLVVLDGRPVSEFHKMNIPGAICCPNGELALRVSRLVPDAATPIVVNCAGRTRSIIGAQTLINLGIPNPVYALENGTQGWYLADLPLEHGGTQRYGDDSASSALQAQARALAERFDVPEVDADTVRAWSQDAARTLFLCDVRTPEEFKAGSLPGAQHTPGGQLMQAGDQYVGVRGARLVLFDSDGVRAPVVASWLRQLGHDACVLRGGLHSGLDLAPAQPPQAPALAGITAQALHERMRQGEVAVVDLRAGMKYRAGHIAGARWSIRPCLASDLSGETRQIVLVADEPGMAQWAALELQGAAPLLLEGGLAAWQQAGLPVEATPDSPTDAECIDYLFFVHDRHDGNKEAARRYLAWETGLVPQLDAQELAAFRLPSA